jgi:hypothetical protein
VRLRWASQVEAGKGRDDDQEIDFRFRQRPEVEDRSVEMQRNRWLRDGVLSKAAILGWVAIFRVPQPLKSLAARASGL